MDNFRFGVVQSQESSRFALNLQSFAVTYFEDTILHSKFFRINENNEMVEENQSNQSYSNNQSITEDYPSS